MHRVQQRGIDVWCGMIVGFDHDDTSIFEVMPKFLADRAHLSRAHRHAARDPDDAPL